MNHLYLFAISSTPGRSFLATHHPYQLHATELIHQSHISRHNLLQGVIELTQLLKSFFFGLFVLICIQLLSREDPRRYIESQDPTSAIPWGTGHWATARSLLPQAALRSSHLCSLLCSGPLSSCPAHALLGFAPLPATSTVLHSLLIKNPK